MSALNTSGLTGFEHQILMLLKEGENTPRALADRTKTSVEAVQRAGDALTRKGVAERVDGNYYLWGQAPQVPRIARGMIVRDDRLGQPYLVLSVNEIGEAQCQHMVTREIVTFHVAALFPLNASQEASQEAAEDEVILETGRRLGTPYVDPFEYEILLYLAERDVLTVREIAEHASKGRAFVSAQDLEPVIARALGDMLERRVIFLHEDSYTLSSTAYRFAHFTEETP